MVTASISSSENAIELEELMDDADAKEDVRVGVLSSFVVDRGLEGLPEGKLFDLHWLCPPTIEGDFRDSTLTSCPTVGEAIWLIDFVITSVNVQEEILT
jgi:hypothetical protein